MESNSPIEQKNKKRARTVSFVIHAILLLLALFMTIEGIPNHPEPIYEVEINFSFEPSSNSTKSESTSGKERAKVDEVTEIEQHKAKEVEVEVPKEEKVEIEVPKANPTPTDPVVSEIFEEDETDVVAVEEDIDIEDPEEDIVPDPEPVKETSKKSTTKSTNTKKSTSTSSGGTTEGKDNKDSSASNNKKGGTGTGKSNKGNGKGDGKKGNDNDSGIGTGGVGSGAYDGSGDGVFGRKVVHVARDYNFKLSGTMAIKICIDRKGNVVYAQIIEEETTVRDRSTLKKVLKLIKKYKFERDGSAPAEQCGKTRITIDDKRDGDENGPSLRFF